MKKADKLDILAYLQCCAFSMVYIYINIGPTCKLLLYGNKFYCLLCSLKNYYPNSNNEDNLIIIIFYYNHL